jgi:hypothetical protein
MMRFIHRYGVLFPLALLTFRFTMPWLFSHEIVLVGLGGWLIIRVVTITREFRGTL